MLRNLENFRKWFELIWMHYAKATKEIESRKEKCSEQKKREEPATGPTPGPKSSQPSSTPEPPPFPLAFFFLLTGGTHPSAPPSTPSRFFFTGNGRH
jgi:hypothetical protein